MSKKGKMYKNDLYYIKYTQNSKYQIGHIQFIHFRIFSLTYYSIYSKHIHILIFHILGIDLAYQAFTITMLSDYHR